MEQYKTLDDIGFIGNQNYKYTDEEAKSVSAFIQYMKAKRKERTISQEEMQHFADEFYKANHGILPGEKYGSMAKSKLAATEI
jgi:hypothetical protein